jgi:hydroxymethylpyrimidine/phosphomethylpyrimidine kinase
VLVAKGGARLLRDDALAALLSRLLPLAHLVTPNAPEAAALAGTPVEDVAGMRRAAVRLIERGARAVLVKGGHLPGAEIVDLLVTREGERAFTHARVETRSTHGTGCTLASAVAAGLARGAGLEEAVEAARGYVREAIREAPGLGRGTGPLDHGWPLRARR